MLAQMKVHNDKFMAAFTNQDPESIGPLYTSDCKVMPTGQDVIEGRPGMYFMSLHICMFRLNPALPTVIGCVEYFGSVMKAGAAKCVVTVDEVGPMGADAAYERTHFKMYKSDGSLMIDGK